MKQKCGISLSQEKRLAMTYCLQKALALLQMPQIELGQMIQEEIEKNPLLEEKRPALKKPIEKEIEAPFSLEESLLSQIRENFPNPDSQKIANKLLIYLDERGFLSSSEEKIASDLKVELSSLQSLLKVLQTFKPLGIFARNLQESLLIQLEAKEGKKTVAYAIVKDHYQDFIHGRFSSIRKKIGPMDFAEVIRQLALLQLRPLDHLKNEEVFHVIPDLIFKSFENTWFIEMNEEPLPQFEIVEKYTSIPSRSEEEKEVMKGWLSAAKTLIHSLSRRKSLLLKLGAFLAKYQSNYLFQKGDLKKITAKDLAMKLHLHESTISRSLSHKYVQTPRGILPLKSLLTALPEKKKAKECLKELISQEKKGSPFTDEELSEQLQKMGHRVSRRTISKYRTELKILPASMRKNSS